MKARIHRQPAGPPLALTVDRAIGLVLAAAMSIAAMVWRAHPAVSIGCMTLAAAVTAVSLVAPQHLPPFGPIANQLARSLGQIARFALECAFTVPFGVIMQIRTDPLRSRPTEQDETFWIVPEVHFGPDDVKRPS